MQYITVNESFTAVLRIPESSSGDTVTYIVRKASDGTVFASGTASWVGSNHWKCTFTPTTVNEVYVVEISDSTVDVESAEAFKATQSTPVATEETSATTDSELLTRVTAAISSRLNGGGVNSYSMRDGRNLQYMTLDELIRLKEHLEKRISSAKTQKQTTTHPRFNRPL